MDVDQAEAVKEEGLQPPPAMEVDDSGAQSSTEDAPALPATPVSISLDVPAAASVEIPDSLDALGTKRSLDPDAPLSGRQKKQRSVKFSSPKGENGRVRRVVATAASTQARAQMIALGMQVDTDSEPNHDFCDACGGKGHFLCCDGCPRSFHFACLEPPLQLDELPSESWYCKVCRAAKAPRPTETPQEHQGLFGPLIKRAEQTNAKVFKLPDPIKFYYKEVSQTTAGDYVDLDTLKVNKLNKHGLPDEREPFKTRDRSGRPILCYECRTTASQAQNRKILACDFCDQHFHLDCLDPPLAGLPPTSRRWRCPLHADEAFPKKRQPKSQTTLTQNQRNMPNSGLIDIIPRKNRSKGVPDYDESVVNGVRYQVPEETVILDFWDKLNGISVVPAYKVAKSGKVVKRFGGPASNVSSPLSSISSSPEPETKSLPKVGRLLARQDSEAPTEERMILDVNGVASPLPEDGRTLSPSSMAESRLSSPGPLIPALLEHSASLLPPDTDLGENEINGLVPPPPSSSGERRRRSLTPVAPSSGHSERAATPNSAVGTSVRLKLTLPAAGHASAAKRSAGDSRESSPGSARPLRSSRESPAPVASTSATRLEPDAIQFVPAPAVRRVANGASSLRQSLVPEASDDASDAVQEPMARRGSRDRFHSQPAASELTVTDQLPQLHRRSSSHKAQSSPDSPRGELAVQNKEDLKALAHVRKMLRGEAYMGQKDTLMDFLGADSPHMPKMSWLDGSASLPWSLPWQEQDNQKTEVPLPPT